MAATSVLEENKRIARRFPEDVATRGDLDLIDEICTEDVVDRSPQGESRGLAAVKEQIEGLRDAVDDFSATVEEVVAEGDTVVMRVTLAGTQTGEFMGIPATGKSFSVDNVVFTRIEDGKIAERWVMPDMLGVMQQLGVLELPTG